MRNSSKDQPPLPLAQISAALHAIAHMMDAGLYDDVTLADIQKHAAAGTLMALLREGTKDLHLLRFLERAVDFLAWYNRQVHLRCSTRLGMDRLGYIVNTRGLCALLAITADIIQDVPKVELLGGAPPLAEVAGL
jgi:hypothetical protein